MDYGLMRALRGATVHVRIRMTVQCIFLERGPYSVCTHRSETPRT